MRLINCPFLLLLVCLIGHQGLAQPISQQAKRYEIDAKRIGVSYMSRDALPRSREFKQIDSTYYVGWMYEGAYLMDHAADELGFQLAAVSLQKALDLLEHDYKKELYTRTGDAMTYINIMTIHRDWDFIQYALYQSYAYSNQIEAAWKNLQRACSVNLQDELMTETYNLMAWTVHRYRQHTSKSYSFLKNSITENESYAHALLDSSLQKVIRDQTLMQSFLALNYRKEREPGIWHYRAILHGYALNIPKAATCYNQLKETPYFPENNYGTFHLIQGSFNEAAHYYDLAKNSENNDKRLKESYYYSSILHVYQNSINKSVDEIKELISVNGSTPGFGWYQLALARLYLNNGQLHLAGIALEKAGNFHEIHIGTTLGETHYQFTLTSLLINRYSKLLHLQHQADRYWWLKPDKLLHSLIWYWKRYQEKLKWIDLLKNNAERSNVIYNLFSSESTVSFDEVITCLDGISPKYFNQVFTGKLKNDTLRPLLKPYWHYAIAKQLMATNQWKDAQLHLTKSLALISTGNNTYHHLLIGRIHEALIECLSARKLPIPPNYYCVLMNEYPQLIPSSNIAFPITLKYTASPAVNAIIATLKRSNFTLVHNTNVPILEIKAEQMGTTQIIQGEWHIPGQQDSRKFQWNNLESNPSNERVFQPLFQL